MIINIYSEFKADYSSIIDCAICYQCSWCVRHLMINGKPFYQYMLGFGQSSYWKDNALKPILDGHKMKFKDALHIVATNTVPLLLLPRWALSVTRGLRKADLAVQELTVRVGHFVLTFLPHPI